MILLALFFGVLVVLAVLGEAEPLIAAFCLCLPVSIAATNISAGLLTLALVVRRLKGGTVDLRRVLVPSVYALCAYLAAAMLASAAGVSPASSFLKINKDFHKLWALCLFLVALPLAGRFRPPRALGLGFAFIALYSLVVDWQIRRVTGHWSRAHGFVHPVTFGEQMALAWLAGLCFLERGEDSASRRWAKPWLALMSLLLVMSDTRGAWAGLAAGYGALCLVASSFRRKGLWALGTAAAALTVMQTNPNGRSLAALLHPEAGSGGWDRLVLWKGALDLFKTHPLFGIGPSNFSVVVDNPLHGPSTWTSAHNLYLHQLSERGLVGLGALFALLGTMTARSFSRARESPTAWNLWAWSSMIAFWVMNLTEVAFQQEQLMTLVLFIWAWAEANHPKPANKI